MTTLSVLIPSRNEMFLAKTIESVLANSGETTEVITILDGTWADPHIVDNPRVQIIHFPQSVGQRAAVNVAARVSTTKYLMKLDAHCAVDKDFDTKLIAPYESSEINDETTTIPRMYNLHAFDWQCKQCGNRTYQGPRPAKCMKCDNVTEFEMVIVWQPRLSRRTDFARFDSDMHFQYWGSYKNRPEAQDDLADVMSSVGACWFMPRERFFELGCMDEAHGSWGQFGTEIACKSWLSGGRQIVNKRTWFSHMFRTQPGFGFPYQISGTAQEKARTYSRWLWKGDNWPRAQHSLSWLVEKFSPVPGW